MIRFGYVVEPPFNFLGPDGRISGSDVELARVVAARLGQSIAFVETDFADLLPDVAARRLDLTTGLFITEQRRSMVRFTRPIWALTDGLLIRGGNPYGIESYSSLAARGARLAVVRGQVQHEAALAAGVPGDRTLLFESYSDAAAAIESGTADAFASVALAHRAYLAAKERSTAALVEVPHTERPPALGAFALSCSDPAFEAAIDAVLSDWLGTPEHRALLARFGLGDTEFPA